MKKIVCLFLAILMLLPLAVIATADVPLIAPSIEQKEAPEPKEPIEGLDDRKQKTLDVKLSDLFVTAYANRDCNYPTLTKEQNEAIKKGLEDVFKDVSRQKDMGDLIPKLNEIAKKINPTYTSANFYVKDLFDISTLGDYFKDNGIEYLRITFDVPDVTADAKPTFVTYDLSTKKYSVVDEKDVTKNPDGTMTVDFLQIGQILILGTTDEKVIPPTGDTQNLIIWAVVAIVSIVLAVSLIVYRRRQH